MSKLINLGWVLSILAFLVVLLFNYAYLEEPVHIYKSGKENIFISREFFFYAGLGIFLFTNTVCISFSRLLGIKGVISQATFKRDLLVWFNGLSLIINIFFILTAFFVSALNNAELMDAGRFYVLVFPAIGFLAIWFLSFVFVWLKKKTV